MMKHVLRYCCLALAACFGSFAYASVDPVVIGHSLKMAVADAGFHGSAVATFNAKQACQASNGERMCSSTNALMKDSHGYLQASASEVTKGTTGSTVTILG